jgi:hypothetical protein
VSLISVRPGCGLSLFQIMDCIHHLTSSVSRRHFWTSGSLRYRIPGDVPVDLPQFRNARSSCTILIAGGRSVTNMADTHGVDTGYRYRTLTYTLSLRGSSSLAILLILRYMQVGKLGAAIDQIQTVQAHFVGFSLIER